MINNIPESYQPAFGSLIFMLFLFGFIALVLHSFGPKSHNMALRKLQDKEREANMVSTKPLPENWIRYINISNLNLDQLKNLSSDTDFLYQLNILIQSLFYIDKKPFIIPDLTLTNIDIKQEYGPVTLQTYINYEQTHGMYCQKLLSLSQFLEKHNFAKESAILLNELVNLKCDSSAPYILLCEIYLQNNDKNSILKLKDLVTKPEYFKNSDFGKSKVLEKINETLNQF